MNDLGSTGKFPSGKLNETDEGELLCAVSCEKGVVRIDFGEPTAWLGLPPDHALAFANAIIYHAMILKGAQA